MVTSLAPLHIENAFHREVRLERAVLLRAEGNAKPPALPWWPL